jgi:RNA polymerase sigma-70 factor, ECF subfamily
MGDGNRPRFEREMLPHLDAAHDLARWLLGNGEDAKDATQEAVLRAFKYFDGFHGDNAKAWLLRIVRNTCYSWIRNRPQAESMSANEQGDFDPEHERALEAEGHGPPPPDARLIAACDRRVLNACLQALPPGYREILILREIEELSYKEISEVAGIPIGTVMSRLARARSLLRQGIVQ